MIYNKHEFLVSMPTDEDKRILKCDQMLYNKLEKLSHKHNSGVSIISFHETSYIVSVGTAFDTIWEVIFKVNANTFKNVCIEIFGDEKICEPNHSHIESYIVNPFSASVRYKLIPINDAIDELLSNKHLCSFNIIDGVIYDGKFVLKDAFVTNKPDKPLDHFIENQHKLHMDLEEAKEVYKNITNKLSILNELKTYTKILEGIINDIGIQVRPVMPYTSKRETIPDVDVYAKLHLSSPYGSFGDTPIPYGLLESPETLDDVIYRKSRPKFNKVDKYKRLNIFIDKTIPIPSKDYDDIVHCIDEFERVKNNLNESLKNFDELDKPPIKPPFNPDRPPIVRPPFNPDRPPIGKPDDIKNSGAFLIYMMRTEGYHGYSHYEVCTGDTPEDAIKEYTRRLKVNENIELNLVPISYDKLIWKDYFEFRVLPLPARIFGGTPPLRITFDRMNNPRD